MDWIKVSIVTTNAGIEPVSYLLGELGHDGIEISDKDDFREFLENNRKYWDYVDEELEKLKSADTRITLYLSDDEGGRAELSEISDSVLRLKKSDVEGVYGTLEIMTANVCDEDWSENWKKYFKPLEIGKKVLILPEWEPMPSETDRVVFRVNPGMTFGTGTHDSTRFCIEEIEKYVKDGADMLDLGCGSGILSIIALLLGAGHADAVDIDPNAVDVAYSNLALNDIERNRYNVVSGDVVEDAALREGFGRYDVVAANIVADVIMSLAPYVRGFMKPGGVFICSGIINERAAEVENSLKSAGLNVINKKQSAEWTAYTCTVSASPVGLVQT